MRYPRFMTRDSVKTAVVGAGYVGIATAVGLAEQDDTVVPVERDPARLAALAEGRVAFYERGLPDAYAAQTDDWQDLATRGEAITSSGWCTLRRVDSATLGRLPTLDNRRS